MTESKEYVRLWRARAYYTASLGDFDDARKFLTHAADLLHKAGRRRKSNSFLIAAYIELYSGERDKARKLLEKALATLCELDRIVFSQAFQPDVGYLVT